MFKHHDLIDIYANNKADAKQKAIEFLSSYQKKDIFIIGVEGANNHYEVEVQYYDKYEDNAVFISTDYKLLLESDIKSLKLKI